MTRFSIPSSSNQAQGTFRAVEQNPALQGGGYSQRATNFIPPASDKCSINKGLIDYSVKHPSSKVNADNENFCREWKEVKPKKREKSSTPINIELKNSGFFLAEKTSCKSVPVEFYFLKEARNREKKLRYEVPVDEEIICQEETDQIDVVDIGLAQSSILYQGRKNYDHFSSEGKAYKKYDSEGTRTPMSRDKRQIMVSLKETDWQARTRDGQKLVMVQNSDDDSEQLAKIQEDSSTDDALIPEWLWLESTESSEDGLLSSGDEAFPEYVTTSEDRDKRPLRNKLKAVENEAFEAHLREMARRKHRYEEYGRIMKDQSWHHSAAVHSRNVKHAIKDGIQEVSTCHERGIVSLVGVDPEYEASMKAENDEHEQKFCDELCRNEAKYNDDENSVKEDEDLLQQQCAQYQDHLEALCAENEDLLAVDRDKEAKEADRQMQIKRMVDEAKEEERMQDITFDSIYALAKGRIADSFG